MKRVAVIMAGGAGERFWPLSRKNYPKQLLHLNTEEHSILEETLLRIAPLIPTEDVFIITNELLAAEIRNSLPNLPPQNVIPEPCKRNTAPCLALTAAFIAAKYKGVAASDISIAVLTADQKIEPNKAFLDVVQQALTFAEQEKKIVTIGISPTRPDTGYGYIETAKPFAVQTNVEFQEVIRFCEKPSLQQAKEYIGTGRFTWNSGMFFFCLDTFIEEMRIHSPKIAEIIPEITTLLQGKTECIYNRLEPEITNIFDAQESISIDYALMEKTRNIAVCNATFDWDDIGAWDSLDRTKQHDADGNVKSGRITAVNCKNSILLNKSNRQIVVAGLDLDEMVVIATDDAIMLCPKSSAQSVKQVVEAVKMNYGEELL